MFKGIVSLNLGRASWGLSLKSGVCVKIGELEVMVY